MRISVCEFLRIQTGTGWCYLKPGIWISDRWSMEARRDAQDDDIVNLYNPKTNKLIKTLEYWSGPSSHDVRARNQKIIEHMKKRAKK